MQFQIQPQSACLIWNLGKLLLGSKGESAFKSASFIINYITEDIKMQRVGAQTSACVYWLSWWIRQVCNNQENMSISTSRAQILNRHTGKISDSLPHSMKWYEFQTASRPSFKVLEQLEGRDKSMLVLKYQKWNKRDRINNPDNNKVRKFCILRDNIKRKNIRW